MVRRWAVVGALAFAGCESLRDPAPPPPDARRESPSAVRPLPTVAPLPTPPPAPAVPVARSAHGTGVVPAAAAEPVPESDPLTLAAQCLERGDRVTAAEHLEAYVRRNPDQLMFRAQLAELLVRLGRDDAARFHYEQFAADACRAAGPPKDHLVHVHTRLMEIGQRRRDPFAELYHRGVGLLLLLAEEDANPDRDPAFCEEMVCKAVKTLAEAKELKPDDARVRASLAEAYDRTGNRRAAETERTAAKSSVGGGAGLMLPR